MGECVWGHFSSARTPLSWREMNSSFVLLLMEQRNATLQAKLCPCRMEPPGRVCPSISVLLAKRVAQKRACQAVYPQGDMSSLHRVGEFSLWWLAQTALPQP